jgi:hypothetical protein
MDADERLEEESVGQLPRLRAQVANRECLLEGLSNLGFVGLLNPDQDERRITGLERSLRRLHDGAIQTITVCERACRHQREESEPGCYRYHLRDVGHAHGAPPSTLLTLDDPTRWQRLSRRSPHRENRQRDAGDR